MEMGTVSSSGKLNKVHLILSKYISLYKCSHVASVKASLEQAATIYKTITFVNSWKDVRGFLYTSYSRRRMDEEATTPSAAYPSTATARQPACDDLSAALACTTHARAAHPIDTSLLHAAVAKAPHARARS
jgi:hypothetical protein